VVLKQWWYPNSDVAVEMCERAGSLTYAEQDLLEDATEYEDEPVHQSMTGALILMPIINGVFITLASQLDPHTKTDALEWADAAIESETYMYRARALHYSQQTHAGWRTDAKRKHSATARDPKLPTTTYRKRCEGINAALYDDSTFAQTNLSYSDHSGYEHVCSVLKFCWTSGWTNLTTLVLCASFALFVQGFAASGWVFDISTKGAAGHTRQFFGALVMLVSFALLACVSIISSRVLPVLWVILALSAYTFGQCWYLLRIIYM
jgi:hypothetical protein